MSSVRISLDNISYKSKADCTDHVAHISNRIGKQIKNLSPKDMLEYLARIGAGGQTFCPATFKNRMRKKDNFEQMQLFVLDFDGRISYEDVIL